MKQSLSGTLENLAVGERFVTARHTIAAADVAQFAELTGDHHPQHTDAEWAAGSLFGERVAHGLLVLSCAAGLVPFDPERVVALRSLRDVVFKRPVRLGEAISVEGKVAGAKPLDEGIDLVTVALRVLLDDGKLAVRATLEVVWRSEPR